MSIIAITGWNFSFEELFEKFKMDRLDNCSPTEFENKFDNLIDPYIVNEIYFATDINSYDCEYIFGPQLFISNEYNPNPINLELLYSWFKETKHQLMKDSSEYYPFDGVAAEPKLYIVSREW